MKLAVSVLLVALMVGGCSKAAAPVAPTPTVSAMQVVGTAPTIGASIPFTATATMSNGTTQAVTALASWTSSATSVATVSASGTVTAVSAGDVEVRATYQAVVGTLRITIAPLPTFTLTGVLTQSTTLSPLGGASVTIVDGFDAGRATVTDGNGFYSLGGIRGGTFTLRASKTGFSDVSRQITLSGDMRVDVSIVPSSGGGTLTCGASTVPSIVDCLNDLGRLAPTARCDDGKYSCSTTRSGTCSGHGGVFCYVCPGPLC